MLTGLADPVACAKPAVTPRALAGMHVDDLVDSMLGHRHTPVARVPRLPATLPSALVPSAAHPLLTGQTVGRGRLRRRRRILLTHRQLSTQFGDLLRLLRELSPQLLILASQSLQLFRVSLAPLRHASDGTPITRGVQDPLNYKETVPVSLRRSRPLEQDQQARVAGAGQAADVLTSTSTPRS
jgi:hypothetical protein